MQTPRSICHSGDLIKIWRSILSRQDIFSFTEVVRLESYSLVQLHNGKICIVSPGGRYLVLEYRVPGWTLSPDDA